MLYNENLHEEEQHLIQQIAELHSAALNGRWCGASGR